MGGYRRPPKLTQLRWAPDQDLHGLEVTLRELPVDGYLAMNRMGAEISRLESAARMTPEEQEQLADLADRFFTEFAAGLHSWNLEDETGEPVPADRAGVGAQGLGFILDLAMRWMGAVGSVDTPLPNGSAGSSQPPPETLIPAETL